MKKNRFQLKKRLNRWLFHLQSKYLIVIAFTSMRLILKASFFFIAAFLILVETVLNQIPAPSPWFYGLGQFFYRIGYSMVASIIFYFFNVQLPEEKKKVKTIGLVAEPFHNLLAIWAGICRSVPDFFMNSGRFSLVQFKYTFECFDINPSRPIYLDQHLSVLPVDQTKGASWKENYLSSMQMMLDECEAIISVRDVADANVIALAINLKPKIKAIMQYGDLHKNSKTIDSDSVVLLYDIYLLLWKYEEKLPVKYQIYQTHFDRNFNKELADYRKNESKLYSHASKNGEITFTKVRICFNTIDPDLIPGIQKKLETEYKLVGFTILRKTDKLLVEGSIADENFNTLSTGPFFENTNIIFLQRISLLDSLLYQHINEMLSGSDEKVYYAPIINNR